MSDTTSQNEQRLQDDALDVRTIPPAQRHPMIFQRFVALPVGGSFVLVNDHDTRPLYYQLNFEYAGQLGWDFLEQGPKVWRVCISRRAPESQGRQRHIALHPVTKEAK
ncbi:MAG: DUF2249 domain-containing protein [Ktedonobacterales bacterium]|nr:DUF2249 domain-containing protein [Ktedonobacterales bacterium]